MSRRVSIHEALDVVEEYVGTPAVVLPIDDRELAQALRDVPVDVLRREFAAFLPHLRRIARVHGR